MAIAVAARAAQHLEEKVAGQPYLEALVIAILLGVVVRTTWDTPDVWKPGITFSAKALLEFAVVLLGASISFEVIATAGVRLLAGIAITVCLALACSYAISRLLGLPRKISILIACGNSICGNSAIAAVAPIIGAEPSEVSASIAFTAVLGVIVVLGLPNLVPLLHLTFSQYGVLAGLTVYAVPQVLAATVPVSAISTQVGTVVKLVRVLMLQPVVVALSLLRPILNPSGDSGTRFPKLRRLIPWFIVGFLAMATLRSYGLIPVAALDIIGVLAKALTIMAMAALGLGVDLRELSRVGGRATAAVAISLIVLVAISATLIRVLGVA